MREKLFIVGNFKFYFGIFQFEFEIIRLNYEISNTIFIHLE